MDSGHSNATGFTDSDETLGIGTWTWRPDTGTLSWSAGVYDLLRQRQSHPASWPLWVSRIHPEDRGEAERMFLQPGGPFLNKGPTIYRLARDDGSVIWIEDRRRLDKAGVIIGAFIDVTSSRLHHDSQLNPATHALQAVSAAKIGLILRDFENKTDQWNGALYEICGLDASRVSPGFDQPLPVTHPEDVPEVRGHIDGSRPAGDRVDMEYRIITPAGEHRWVRERGSYFRAKDGRLLRYCGVVEDLSGTNKRVRALEERRRLLSLALESNGIGVWEWNRTTGQQVWSDEFYRIMGYEPGEVTACQEIWRASLHPSDREWACNVFEADGETGVQLFTYRIYAAGKLRWIRESWRDYVREDGSRICIGVTADVTDWKEREHRLMVTDKWLQLAVNGGRLGLWSHDEAADVLQWNEQMFALLGYRPGEITPTEQAWYGRIHPDDVERVKAELLSGRASGGEIVTEYRVLHPNGVERWMEERGNPRDAGSHVYDGVFFDITDRKTLLQQLEAGQQRLQLALDTGGMGFWSGYGEDEVWDERTYRLLGYEPFSVKADNHAFMRVVHPDDREDVAAADERLRLLGTDAVQEYRIVRADGKIRWLESQRRIAPHQRPDRFGVVVDITERKSREEMRLRSQRLGAAGQLLRGVAHDFNNFLAVISGMLELLGDSQADAAAAGRLLEARRAVEAGSLFSRRLVNITASRAWQPQRLSIGIHVSRLASVMSPVLKQNITFSVECPDDVWPVQVDPLELDSALINLIINARDAIVTSGEVKITAANHPADPSASPGGAGAREFVVITVQDTGMGMDEATLQKATEPFFTTKPEGEGTGLGLSSVAAFTSAADGHLRLESRPGEGTSVSLFLPRAHDHDCRPAAPSRSLPRGNGELVLLVDDNPLIRDSFSRRLEVLGYAVVECTEAGSALETLQSTRDFALVLSDISMPGSINGFDLRDRLAEKQPHLAVLLITAHEELVNGDSRIISKSCSQAELASAVASILELRRTDQPDWEGTRETGKART